MERETGAREGLKGWLNPSKIGKFGIERLAWLLMRLTGLGLLAYFIGHIYETSHILDGKAVWDKSLERQRGKGTTEDLYWWYKKQTKMGQTPSEIAIQLGRKTTAGLLPK